MSGPTWFDWVQFWVSMALLLLTVFYLIGDYIPGMAGAGSAFRRWSWQAAGLAGWWLIDHVYVPLWRGFVSTLQALWGRAPSPPEPANVSTLSVPLPARYVQTPPWDDAEDPQTNHGLSGLSATEAYPQAPDHARAYLETLDSGSRKYAVALLVLEEWRTGQIRKVLKGDSGEIGREVAEARRRLGLDDEDDPAPRQTPVAGREVAEGVEFREAHTA